MTKVTFDDEMIEQLEKVNEHIIDAINTVKALGVEIERARLKQKKVFVLPKPTHAGGDIVH